MRATGQQQEQQKKRHRRALRFTTPPTPTIQTPPPPPQAGPGNRCTAPARIKNNRSSSSNSNSSPKSVTRPCSWTFPRTNQSIRQSHRSNHHRRPRRLPWPPPNPTASPPPPPRTPTPRPRTPRRAPCPSPPPPSASCPAPATAAARPAPLRPRASPSPTATRAPSRPETMPGPGCLTAVACACAPMLPPPPPLLPLRLMVGLLVVVLDGWVVLRWLAVQGCRGCLLGWSRAGKQWGDLSMRLVVACDLWSSVSAASCSPFALFFPFFFLFLSSFSRELRLALGGRAHHKHTYIAHFTELRLAWLGGRSGELVACGRTNGRFIVIFFPLFSPFPPFFFPFRISLLVLALSGFFLSLACLLPLLACLPFFILPL